MIIETITKDKTVRVQNYISPNNIIRIVLFCF